MIGEYARNKLSKWEEDRISRLAADFKKIPMKVASARLNGAQKMTPQKAAK